MQMIIIIVNIKIKGKILYVARQLRDYGRSGMKLLETVRLFSMGENGIVVEMRVSLFSVPL